jgi:hypothetical protein
MNDEQLQKDFEKIFSYLHCCLMGFITQNDRFPFGAIGSALGDLYLNTLIHEGLSKQEIMNLFLQHYEEKISQMKNSNKIN